MSHMHGAASPEASWHVGATCHSDKNDIFKRTKGRPWFAVLLELETVLEIEKVGM